jgi:hypothetical protein
VGVGGNGEDYLDSQPLFVVEVAASSSISSS